jgi:hypothetical protein
MGGEPATMNHTVTEGHAHTEPFIMRRNIHCTAYEVAVYFSQTSHETLTDKILRLIRNEVRR